MPDPIQNILEQFRNFDRNDDGDPSIASLSYLSFESPLDEIPPNGRLILALVEPRLLEPLPAAEDLLPVLLRHKGDLRAEGLFSRFIRAEVYHGARNQDGRTLLAMRRFLREVKLAYPNFTGVVLVGMFPEAPIVRRCLWRLLDKGKPVALGLFSRVIATRGEIVLSDLNGNWHLLYHEEPEQLEDITAKPDAVTAATPWPMDGAVFSSADFIRTYQTFRDFFYIQDDDTAVESLTPGSLRILIRTQPRHPELSALDRTLPNPLARPDILVSRINAVHVAVNPDPTIHGDDGTPPLDAAGLPRAFTSAKAYDLWLGFFARDPVFERRLLRNYFDRNHRFRTGAFANLPFRAGAVAAPGFNANGVAAYLAPASGEFGPPLVAPAATLLDYVRWFKQPAALRAIDAHSCAFNSGFGDQYDPKALEQEVGGRPFRWRRSGNTYAPSLQDQGGNADFFVHRSMWQSGALSDAGANLIIHCGCLVNDPANWQDNSSSASYGSSFQNAEGLLFYMNGVALVSRAKDYWDSPEGFPAALGAAPRANFGDAWKAYYESNGANAQMNTIDDPFTGKKAYFWSMIGDWTVRLRYRGGLAVLGLQPQLRALHVHADQAWIGGWNFDTNASTVRGAGDMNGDGASEFLVSSSWGIGILGREGECWHQILVAPNGTRFGGWLLNTANDRFGPIADFDGDGRAEILISNAWGVAVLGLRGDTLQSLVMAGNGTRLDGWMLNTANDRFGPIGDFDGDGRVEILVTNAWGVGILALRGDTLKPLFMAANGARLDGWMLDTANDHFGLVADFDGDGRDEILVADAQGVVILALDANALHPKMTAANGVRFDGWLLNTANDRFDVAGDLNGDGRAEVIVRNAWGIAVVGLEGSALRPLLMAANGSHFGSWRLDTAVDRFGPAADLNGDGRAVLMVANPQGLGVLAMRGNSLDALSNAANGTSLGDWVWERNDCIVDAWHSSASAAKCELLIQKGSPCALPSPFPAPARARPRKAKLITALASFALE